MPILIAGATLIDGVVETPQRKDVLIEGIRILAVGAPGEIQAPPGTETIDAHGKFLIPGIVNANVHLMVDVSLENVVRYMDQFEELIIECAQVALKNGITTVFDTWGPRRFLINVREKINRGELIGSRIFCAGNIVGFDGPFSHDFNPKALEIASASLTNRVNAIWVENVGRHLMWLPPEEVAREVRAYLGKGVDFIKYASNEHFGTSAGAFIEFSPDVQKAIVEEARRAGTTAQAHITSVEGLKIAVQAGCSLIQHANLTGPVPIPYSTLELMAQENVGAVLFPWTAKGFDWLMTNVTELEKTMWRASDENVRRFIASGAPLLMANDGAIVAAERIADPAWEKCWGGVPAEDSLYPIESGHLAWFRAMEEKGCSAMAMLKAATINVARAYGKDADFGTIEPGKFADIVILDKNPLDAAANYRSIHAVMKEGVIIDRETLPHNPILTGLMRDPAPEEADYISFMRPARRSSFPMCSCH